VSGEQAGLRGATEGTACVSTGCVALHAFRDAEGRERRMRERSPAEQYSNLIHFLIAMETHIYYYC